MILGNPATYPASDGRTLDGLFRDAALRRPNAVALCDPPNRAAFTDGTPRRLTYAEADHIVSAIAGRLHRLGLSTDAVVGLQLPNTIEAALAFLGVLRAGMIAAPMPLLWRRADATAALSRCGAKAIVTMTRVGDAHHCDVAMNVAADVFAIRYVCCFGRGLPDGVIPLDDLLDLQPLLDAAVPLERDGNPAAHVAAVTFEQTAAGLAVVARTHTELIAGGQAVVDEAGLKDNAVILASCGIGSFAGLASGLVPWLLTAGTLSLHHPFDSSAFADQCRRDGCDTVVIPGVLAARIARAGLLAYPQLRNVVAMWRAPERLSVGPLWPHPGIPMIDVLAFGETAVICGRRTASGEPADIPLGMLAAAQTASNSAMAAETQVTAAGTLAIRGAMVPRHSFPPGADRSRNPGVRPDASGFVDTHHRCRADRDNGTLQVTGPPAGIVSVGGYRFGSDELQSLAGQAAVGAVLTALPDALAGHRLAGTAGDLAAARRALEKNGVNPLVCDAFPSRLRPDAA